MPGKSKQRVAPKKKQPEKILYVVLHGLITLIDVKDKGFIAHVLDVGSDHKYLHGEWLQEQDIPKRKRGKDPLRLTLINVKKGHGKLKTNLNAVIKVKSIPPDTCGDVRAVIRLPRPRHIYSFVNGKLPAKAIAGDTSKLVSIPTHLSGTQIFEYVFVPDKNHTALVTDSGRIFQRLKAPAIIKPKKEPNKLLHVWVLHIYDEPGHLIHNPHDHNRREFRLSSLFLGTDLDLVKHTGAPPGIRQGTQPHGLLPGELQNLDRRPEAVTPLVITAREGKKAGVGAGGGSAGPVCGGSHAQLQ
jgi:hypothetical protein